MAYLLQVDINIRTFEQNACLAIWLTIVKSCKLDQLTSRFLVTKIKSDRLSLRILQECAVFSLSQRGSVLSFGDDITGGDSIQLTAFAWNIIIIVQLNNLSPSTYVIKLYIYIYFRYVLILNNTNNLLAV